MRRIASIVVAAGVAWTLAACGGPGTPQASDVQRPAIPAAAPAPAPDPVGVATPLPTPTAFDSAVGAVRAPSSVPLDHELDAEIDPPAVPRAAAPRPARPRPSAVPAPVRTVAPAGKPVPTATAKARPPAPTKPSADLVVPRAGMRDVRAAGWERVDVLGQRSLRVHFTGVSACRVLDSVRVDYRPTTVVVTLYTGTDPRYTDRVCAAVAQEKAVDVALAKPLAGRKVLDGSKPASPEQPVAGTVEVRPKPGAVDTRELAWDRVEVVNARTLRVFYNSGVGPCTVLDRVKVGYAADRVTITLVVGRDPAAAGQACAAGLHPVYVDVPLAQPLADRRIVDGA